MSTDALSLLSYEAGLVATPLAEQAAEAAKDLCTEQRLMRIGDPLPIVWTRREGDVGGCLVSPAATEARFENDAQNVLTASWHLVVGEGPMDPLQERDIFQCACRVGTSTQAFGRRAGSWQPGNFTVDRGGSTTPWEVPRYCGAAGTFDNLTTLSFVNSFADGEEWNRQIHAFCRGGRHVVRLLDGVEGPSANVADLYLHLLRSVERTPDSLIDFASLKHAARFTDSLGMRWDGVLGGEATENLDDWCENILKPCFLLTRTRRRGQEGLSPLLPTNNNGTIYTGRVAAHVTLSEQDLDLTTWRCEFLSLADRRPICAQMIWRQQGDGIDSIARTSEVRFEPPYHAPDGPFEQFDLSRFATNERHVVKSGAYAVAHRALATHSVEVSSMPGLYNSTLTDGDIVRLVVPISIEGSPDGFHDYLYRVSSIGHGLDGATRLSLMHLPLDRQGRSAVAMVVAGAEPKGLMLPITRTGPTCDVNSSTNSDPLDEDVVDWNLPDDEFFDTFMPVEDLPIGDPLDSGVGLGGDGGFSVGGGDGGGGGGGGGLPQEPPAEPPPGGPEAPPLQPPLPPGVPPGSPGQNPPANPDTPQPSPPKPTPPLPSPGESPIGPDGFGGPEWGPPGPPVAGVTWDLSFEEVVDMYTTVGNDKNGTPIPGPFGGERYPAGVVKGEWQSKTMLNVSAWTHIGSGATKYEYGAGYNDPDNVKSVGINAIRKATVPGTPDARWSSSGQGFYGTYYTFAEPFRTNVFISQIRNFKVRRHGTTEEFQPIAPPKPFNY